MFILGVITARGGSKGVPRKNLRKIGNISLVGRAVDSANDSRLLSRHLVSTDDQQIAEVAKTQGGWVPFLRPAALADDEAPTWKALQHAVTWFEEDQGTRVDAIMTLQPTTPFRTGADIDEAIRIYNANQSDNDSLISVCVEQEKHPLTLYERAASDAPALKSLAAGRNPTTRRQDFPTVYWRNGAIYITQRDLLFRHQRVVSDHPLFYEMPVERSVNVDTPFDLAVAETAWHFQQSCPE